MKYMFYHLGINGNASEERLAETWDRCRESGLYDELDKIFLYVNHCRKNNPVGDYIKLYVEDKKTEVRFSKKQTATELETVTWLWEFCQELEGNHEIYYSHSKGVFRKNRGFEDYDKEVIYNNVKLWNEYLEYWCMYRREDCWEALKKHYTAGPFLKGSTHEPFHYSGNFWWANSDYIKILHKPDNDIDLTPEFWLLSDLYFEQNACGGLLDTFEVLRRKHFHAVHQPVMYIQNAYIEPILKSSYMNKKSN